MLATVGRGWGEGVRERRIPWHTNRYDRNKIKGVGLRQNMYGPLNRELIKAKAARRFIRACLITHWQSHYLNSGDSSLKCLLQQGTPRWSGQTSGFTSFSRGKCLNPGPSIPIWGYYEAASEALLGEKGLKILQTGRFSREPPLSSALASTWIHTCKHSKPPFTVQRVHMLPPGPKENP